MAALMIGFAAVMAWPQATLTRVNGTVTDGGKPVAGAQVVFTNLNTGKTFKAKTDKGGNYSLVGLERTNYQIDVFNPSGEKVYSAKEGVTGEQGGPGGQMGGEQDVNIDISQGQAKGGQPKYTKEQIEAIKAQNAKAENMNVLIKQAQDAMTAKNWQAAVGPLQQLTTADPKRYEFIKALGDAQFNLAQYDDSIQSYEKAIQAAQATQPDPKVPASDPARLKAAIGQMLTTEGNAYLKLHKNKEAVDTFTKAAAMDPNPGVAYFNLCATQYNTGNTEGAIAACDKAISADPNKADAYFIKGSLLAGQGKQDKDGKYVVPPGTAEALNKYLQLAPDGPHANDTKAMLQMIGAKIETTYKAGKKK
jgi:tetratricopeptide (TPR) repeat protein